jgi:hypothetical protein
VLTLEEVAVTVLALVGIAYNAIYIAKHRADRPWFELYLLLYTLLVVIPQLIVCLYAFTHFQLD